MTWQILPARFKVTRGDHSSQRCVGRPTPNLVRTQIDHIAAEILLDFSSVSKTTATQRLLESKI